MATLLLRLDQAAHEQPLHEDNDRDRRQHREHGGPHPAVPFRSEEDTAEVQSTTEIYSLPLHDALPIFSVSPRPRTNSRCMKTTTATGGSIARMAVAIASCHSASSSGVYSIFLMPVTMVWIGTWVV